MHRIGKKGKRWIQKITVTALRPQEESDLFLFWSVEIQFQSLPSLSRPTAFFAKISQ